MKYNKNISDVQKGIIISEVNAGLNYTAAAKKFKVARSTIQGFCQKFKDTGNVLRKVGSKGNRKTTKRDDVMIVREMQKDRDITGEEIKANLGLQNISERTVRRRITESGEKR